MAALIATSNDDPLAFGSVSRGIQPPRTGSDERRQNGLRSRIRALVGFWERIQNAERITLQRDEAVKPRELWQPHQREVGEPQSPPSYEDSLSDTPPDYTFTGAFAVSYATAAFHGPAWPCESSEKLDLSTVEGIRSYANKKAKKAAKQQQQAKSAGDDEGEKPAEDGGEGGGDQGAGGGDGGGDGDAGGGGDGGGDPPGGDGNGDDNPDDWGFGTASKKSELAATRRTW